MEDGSGSYQVLRGTEVLATGTSSPIEVVLTNNTSTTPFNITVRDANNTTCVGNTRTVTPQNCATCTITDVSISNTACDGLDFVFDVNFSQRQASGSFEVVGNGILLAEGTSSPITVRIPANESTTPIFIRVNDATFADCNSAEVQLIPQNCFEGLNLCYEDAGNFSNEVVQDRTTGMPSMGAWDADEMHYQFNASLAVTDDSEPVEYWAISPFFDLGNATELYLQFTTLEQADATDLEVLWSADYIGAGNPNDATWNILATYTEPGDDLIVRNRIVDLSNLGSSNLANFYVAFRYKDTENYSTWEVSDIRLRGDNCEPTRCIIRNLMRSTNCITDDSIGVTVMFDVASGSGNYEIINEETDEVVAVVEDALTSGNIEIVFGLGTQGLTDSIHFLVVDDDKPACRAAFAVPIPDCVVCFRDDCDFFTVVPVLQNTDRDTWTCSAASGYAVNGFCTGGCSGNSELWIVSRALEFDNATEATFSFDVIENFAGPALEFFYSNNYNGSNTATDIRNATWIRLNSFDRTVLDVVTDLTPINGTFYLAFKYTSRPGANNSSAFNVRNIVLDADICKPASSDCRINQVNYSAGECENQGTSTVADDVFTVNLDVKFDTPPATGTLEVIGSIVTEVPVEELDSDTSHVFVVAVPSNGATLSLEVRFSDDPLCYLVESEIAIAPAPCSSLPDCSFPFFSEYIEISSGNNKALEIYNPTGDTIDLAAGNYVVAIYFNGATTATAIPLTGKIEPNCTYTIVNAVSTNSTLRSKANQLNGNINFNGDDAVALIKGGATGELLDVIGAIGFDPGTEWTGFANGAIVNTDEAVIRRLPTVRAGDNIPFDNFFGIEPEWVAFPITDLSDFGIFQSDCITCDLTFVSATTQLEFCKGSADGQITINADATLPILYSIDGGNNFQTNKVFTNLTAGEYTIILKTAKLENCADTVAIMLNEAPVVTITDVTTTDEICPNDADGSITILANFPNAALEYSVDGGLNYQTSNKFEGLADGNYDIVVRSVVNQGCVSATFTASIAPGEDTQAPTFVCPTDQLVATDLGECAATVNNLAITNITDNCDASPTVTYTLTGATEQAETQGFASGVTFALGTTTVTYKVTDKNGQFATCSFTVTVSDQEAPVFANCPSDIIIANATEFYRNGGIVNWTPPTVSDNCSSVSNILVENNQAPGFEPELGKTTITYTATDETGNTSICTFDIILQDAYVTDPCNCLNNRSNPTSKDGQFAETVTIFSAPGETWKIVNVIGLFKTPAGAFPPASGVRYALVPFQVGQILTEQPVGSGKYILNGLHVESTGYQIVVSNGTSVLSTGNTCNYDIACNGDIAIPVSGGQPKVYTLDCTKSTGFFDDGGKGAPYFDRSAQNNIVIICPDNPASRITKVSFNQFDLAAGDQLLAYDGDNLAAPLITSSNGGTGTGSSVADAPGGGWVQASCENPSGCITFEFIRNGDNVKGAGWDATIECVQREGEFSCPLKREFFFVADECNVIDQVQIPLPTVGSCGTAVLPTIEFSCDAPVYNADLTSGLLTIQNLPVGEYIVTYIDPVFASRTCRIVIRVLPATLTCNDESNVSLTNECLVALTPDLLLENPCTHPNVHYEMYFSDPHVRIVGKTVDGFPIADFSDVPCGTRLDVKLERHIAAACGEDYTDVCWGRLVIEDKEAPVIAGDLVDDYLIACFYDNSDLLARLNAIPRDGRGATLNLKPSRVTAPTNKFDTDLTIKSVETAFTVSENCSSTYQVSNWQAIDYDCTTDAFDGLIANADDALWALMNIEVESPTGVGTPAIFRCYFRVVKAIDDCGNVSNIAIQRICVAQPDLVAPQLEISLPCDADTDPIAMYNLWANDPDWYAEYATYLPNFDPTPLDVNDGFSLFAGLDDTYFTNASGDEVPAYPDHAECGYAIDWEDSDTIEICANNYKIFREWTVYNWCDGHLELLDILPQVIKVGDSDAPELVGEPTFIGTGNSPFYNCASDALLQIEVKSGCSKLQSAYIDFADDNLADAEYEIFNGQILVKNVPIEQVFTYSLRLVDECGNSGSYSPFKGLLEDNIPPAAICERTHAVSLGEDCTVLVPANIFDDGSYDNCGTVSFEVARMESDIDGDGIPLEDEDFGALVQFSATDLAGECTGTAMVVFRVTDGSGNKNTCMVEVEIQDKLRPTCEARAPITLTCFDTLVPQITALLLLSNEERIATWENWLNNGVISGSLNVRDNCSSVTVNVTELDLTGFNLSCNAGIIKYAFYVTDACGFNSDICKETLIIDGDYHDWSMIFPRDRILNCNDRFLQFRIPRPESLDRILEVNRGCDEWAMEVEIETSRASTDACYQLIYNYHLINWCTWDPRNVAPAVVERPNQEFPDSLLLESFQRVRIAYRDQFVNMNFSENAIPTILATVDDNCKTISPFGRDGINDLDDFCDNDEYDLPPRLFNNFGFDADWVLLESNDNTYSRDIPIYEVPSIFTGDTVRYVSAQDYGNIVYRQIIRIYDATAPTLVVTPFDDAFCANNTNGTQDVCSAPVEIFFEVGDACAEKFEIAASYKLKPFLDDAVADPFGTLTNLGDGKFKISGNYPIQIGGDTTSHSFLVEIRDLCSNTEIVEIPFQVVDCKAPTPYCINGLSVDIMPSGEVTLWASDFDAGSFDFCTSPDQLKLTFADPALYPDSISRTFNCSNGEVGVVTVQLWVQDIAGNKAFCETFVNVQNNNNANCPAGNNPLITGSIETEMGEPVQAVDVVLSGDYEGNKSTNITGYYGFQLNHLVESPDFTVTPHKDDDPMNGVSTLDLVLMSKHILGIELLDSPYKIIAADVNNSGSITTFDIVQLRKMILNVTETFESNTSWRFIPTDFVFPDPSNPFASNFPEIININDFDGNADFDFMAIKVGDLNGSAVANDNSLTPRTAADIFTFEVEETKLSVGETYAVHFKAPLSEVQGYQFTLAYDTETLVLKTILDGAGGSEHIAMLQPGILTTSWNGTTDTQKAFSLVFEAKQQQLLSQAIKVTSTHTTAEAYDLLSNTKDIKLKFVQQDLTQGFVLYQNQPNPFKSETTIGFELPRDMEVRLVLHDLTGQVVSEEVNTFKAGKNEIKVNNRTLPAGMLYYTLSTDSFTATKRMIVIAN